MPKPNLWANPDRQCWTCDHFAGPSQLSVLACICRRSGLGADARQGCAFWEQSTKPEKCIVAVGGRACVDGIRIYAAMDTMLTRVRIKKMLVRDKKDGAEALIAMWARSRSMPITLFPVGPATISVHRPDCVVAFPGDLASRVTAAADKEGVTVWWPIR